MIEEENPYLENDDGSFKNIPNQSINDLVGDRNKKLTRIKNMLTSLLENPEKIDTLVVLVSFEGDDSSFDYSYAGSFVKSIGMIRSYENFLTTSH